MELGLNFPHTLENPHIITEDQIHVRVVGKGVSGKHLTSSFERRKDEEYFIELGNTLISMAKVVPDGMLVFFPSYGVMETCLERWGGPATSRPNNGNGKGAFFAAKKKQNSSNQYSFPLAPASYYDSNVKSTPWKRMLSTKSVVVEPRSTRDLPDAMAEFKRFLAMPKSPGCILMGVCRGKISEGIDFSNEMSRAVVITGLPFPPAFDPKVKLKKEFLDKALTSGNIKASADGGFGGSIAASGASNRLSGQDWYTQQAHRAVNQAIGRVIRNKSDYGAVLLLDSRFGQDRNRDGLSSWLRPHIRKDEGFGTAIRTLATFFKGARDKAKEMEKAEAQAAANAVVLEYEDDDVKEEKFTKVAYIRNAAGRDKSGKETNTEEGLSAAEDGPTANSYVAPDQVIARLDVESMRRSRPTSEVSQGGEKKVAASDSAPARYDAIFGSKQASKNGYKATDSVDTKVIAAQFMKKTQQRLTPADQSTIRKSIVAMKGYSDNNDVRSYHKAALDVVRLVIRGESFEATTNGGESKMLLLFFLLLPRKFRVDVETRSFKLVFDTSTLGQLCKENLETEDIGKIRSSVASLLNSLWCPADRAKELSPTAYLPKAQEILRMLEKTDKIASATSFRAYCTLIPPRLSTCTRALFDELKASRNISRMKQAEKARVGEDSLDSARFQLPSKIHAQVPEQETTSKSASTPMTGLQAAVAQKRKRPEVAQAQKQSFNPYAKKPTAAVAAAGKPQVKQPPRQEKPSISAYLKTVESEPYVKKKSGDAVSKMKTNVPKNMSCQICNDPLTQPFIADCGHMACLQCWLGWLKRSETCPTCRVATKKESLARAVFQKDPESKPPTLSQFDEDNDDESDEELEICK
jgi:hypothetical protein